MERQHGIEWRGGVPISTRFDDPYYSLDNGLAETRYVFLEGNDLPARFENGFHIAELGFGTGLSFLTALKAFRESGIQGRLHFTSFEAYPMSTEEMLAALKPYPDLPIQVLDGESDPDFELRIVIGDVRETLPNWDGQADAWFLDGFSPARNPEMWEDSLMAQVGAHTAPGGTFATYTAVGTVRRALETAGFTVEHIQGYGRKRHMTRGQKL